MNQTDSFESTDPATGQINWTGRAATAQDVEAAVSAARAAFPKWSSLPITERILFLNKLVDQFRSNRDKFAETISRETGKPRWESLTEVDAMIGKIPISITAHEQRCADVNRDLAGVKGTMHFRPHGVLGVLGPFNMPGHLPNGHIVPALLAGNTVVFKSSEQTPLVGEEYTKCFAAAGFPPGVLNLLQGAAPVGHWLAHHDGVNGILFTGGTPAGLSLRQGLAQHPEKILALEMGGNNPLIIHESANLDAAAVLVIQSAYITAGQRCSCARRLILCRSKQSDELVNRITEMIANLRIGFWNDEPQPFLGTVISAKAAQNLLATQEQRIRSGAIPIVKMKPRDRSPAILSPGLLDVTPLQNRPDIEIFGPLLQLIYVSDFPAALAEANRTSFGLSAGLISDNAENFRQFTAEIRAGVLSINRPTTGASSHLSFGGIGNSGNHRPGAYLAADYCAYPVASLESPTAQIPKELPPGISI
jgi:succinylglutamic semialdehyde dehydrogenase